MARIQHDYPNNGFYGIGIMHGKHDHNIGTLWRSAYIMGASFIFTLGRAYKQQTSDVVNAWTKIPYSSVNVPYPGPPLNASRHGLAAGRPRCRSPLPLCR